NGGLVCRPALMLLAQPAFEEAERVIPQGVDLNGLAAAGRYYPVPNLGVHPGKLVAFLSLCHETVGRIDMDAEARAAQMVGDDVLQSGQKEPERFAVARVLEVAPERVEEPEGG